TDPWMPATGVRQDEQRRLGRTPWAVVGAHVESHQSGSDSVVRQAGRLGDLLGAIAMVPDHVLEPVLQLRIVLRLSCVRRLGGRENGAGEEQHKEGSNAVQHGSSSGVAGPYLSSCQSGRRGVRRAGRIPLQPRLVTSRGSGTSDDGTGPGARTHAD